MREEIFGPVLVIQAYDDEDEAVRLANDTIFGLNAGVFSGDEEHAIRVARRIRAGQVQINDGALTSTRPSAATGSRAMAESSANGDSRSSWRPNRCSFPRAFVYSLHPIDQERSPPWASNSTLSSARL